MRLLFFPTLYIENGAAVSQIMPKKCEKSEKKNPEKIQKILKNNNKIFPKLRSPSQ